MMPVHLRISLVKSLAFLGAWLCLAAAPAPATASTFYTDFSIGIPTEMSGSANQWESVQGYAGLGTGSAVFSGDFLRNESGGYGTPATPTVLTLTGLPAHTSVSLGFLLAVIDSWDGNSNDIISGYPVGPDFFNVRVRDGNNIWSFSATFSNFSGNTQSYSGVKLGNGFSQRGFNSSWEDSAYDMGLDPVFQNIPHTADTLIVEWFASGAGWQGKNVVFGTTHDESWAIDNVRVDLNPVPLPSTALLLGSGFIGLAGFGWRCRRK
jgi:hypothetical protein